MLPIYITNITTITNRRYYIPLAHILHDGNILKKGGRMNRTISVKGKATITAPADITGVRVSAKGHEDTFEKAINAMTQ